jgi:hypothetical protein
LLVGRYNLAAGCLAPARWRARAERAAIDASRQISGLRKLKLTNCASITAWVERLCETHRLGVSKEAQLVGYGAIDAARWSNVVRAPDPPYALCSLHSLSAA